MRKVFISHSWEDNDISRKLAEYLKRDGADIWIDYTRIHGGDSLPRRISEALEWCDTLILLWSESAKDSYYVNLEWENALDMRKIIIPCPLDETNRPAILRRCLFIDFKNFDSGYRQLAYALDLAIQKEVIKKVSSPIIEKSKQKVKPRAVASRTTGVVALTKSLFRSEPKILSGEDVQSMFNKFNFFDSSWNDSGHAFANQYKAKTIQSDKVVIDGASNLMWQQCGSPEAIEYKSTKKWIADLNNKCYAGYHNWRLPTLEEAMSLIESNKNKDRLYIDSIFDCTQTRIWTCDLVKDAYSVWIVRFDDGRCGGLEFSSLHVRAVRSRQSNKSN